MVVSWSALDTRPTGEIVSLTRECELNFEIAITLMRNSIAIPRAIGAQLTNHMIAIRA